MASTMTEFADRVFSILVDYLHPQDLRKLLGEHIGWRTDLGETAGGEDYRLPDTLEARWAHVKRLAAQRRAAVELDPPTASGEADG